MAIIKGPGPSRPSNGGTHKIALVTGGSRGLGRNAAVCLAKKGIDVILTFKSNETEAAAAVREIEAAGARGCALRLNVGEVKSFDEFFGQVRARLKEVWQRETFDCLVNNAGVGVNAPVTATTEAQFDELMNVHFKGVYFLTQKALPLMADGGRIINISSGLARFAIPGFSAYGAMKAAIEAYTRYLAKELGARRIAANAVAPGAIETDFNKARFEAEPQMKQYIASQTPLGRVGVPDDIGPLVAWLCTEEARWVNAQRIEASGGMNI